jgi:DNA-binding response OmpR family regulator
VRILVVEDEVALADGIARGLEAEGFGVDVVHDGAEGYWRAHEHQYAAIVLDLLLPGMNGFKVCKALRAEGNWTPILVLTAKSGEYDEAEALDTGADDFLSKPFSFVVLVARLRALLRRGTTPRPPTLTSGTLVLDPYTRTVLRGGSEVHLTAREFAVLEALLRRQGGVASKQELLEEVWGADFLGDPNIVEVYIRYLRKKVDIPFGLDTIETVRSAGYRMVPDA